MNYDFSSERPPKKTDWLTEKKTTTSEHHTYQNRQAGRTWKEDHFSNTLYPSSPTAGRAGEDRARRGEACKLCKARNLSGLDETSRGPPVRQTTPTAPQHVLSLHYPPPCSTSFGTPCKAMQADQWWLHTASFRTTWAFACDVLMLTCSNEETTHHVFK